MEVMSKAMSILRLRVTYRKDPLLLSSIFEFYFSANVLNICRRGRASFMNYSQWMGHQEKGTQLGGGEREKWELV
jgi:hypothetical protein